MVGEESQELADVAPIGFQVFGDIRRSAPRWVSQRTIRRATSGADAKPVRFISCRWSWRSSGALIMQPLPSPFLNAAGIWQSAAWPRQMTQARVVDVLVPVALDQAYSYRVPDELALAPGDLVSVPLGAREATGVVWADNVAVKPGLHNRLKDVDDKLDVPPLKRRAAQVRRLGRGLHARARGMVLRMALRMGEHLGPARERVGVRLAGPPPQRMTPARGACWRSGRRAGARQRRGGGGSGREHRRDRRPDRRRHAGDACAAARAGGAASPIRIFAHPISPRRSAPPPTRCARPSRRAAFR